MKEESIDISHWYWSGLHRRGLISMFLRYRALRHIPMPGTGHHKAWSGALRCQIMMCLSERWCGATLTLIERHMAVVMDADLADEEWWKTYAPQGSYSPLGTRAAAEALNALCTDSVMRGHFRGVTMPFLIASIQEFGVLMVAAAIVTLPASFAAIRNLSGQRVGLGELMAVTAIAFVFCGTARAMLARL